MQVRVYIQAGPEDAPGPVFEAAGRLITRPGALEAWMTRRGGDYELVYESARAILEQLHAEWQAGAPVATLYEREP